MELLGFKSLSYLKPYMYIKPGHFLYPDEKVSLTLSQDLKRSVLFVLNLVANRRKHKSV